MRAPTPPDIVKVEATARGDVTPPAPMKMRTAAGTKPPRGRGPNVDDVIESGEIIERRSLVIRSQRPVVEWNDEPTEIAAPPIALPDRRRWRLLWLAGALVCGVIAVLLLARAKPNAAPLEARAEMIGAMLDGEARAVMARARAIAASPVLRAAVETDASTLADMARDNDVTFSLEQGDVLEVFQVRGKERVLLLRLPASTRAIEAPAAGEMRIAAANGTMVAIARAPVTNRTHVTGEIVLSKPIELAPIAKPIGEHASGAMLTGLGEAIVLIANKAAPNVSVPVATKTPVAGTLGLAAVVPRPTGVLAYVFLAASLLLVAVFIFMSVRARRAA